MAEDKKPTVEQQLAKLTHGLAEAHKQIDWMKTRGGFTDAKTHSMRATRIEERVEKLEASAEMLKDTNAHAHALLGEHMRDRHDCDIDRDDAPDAIAWRKWRRRLREWAEKQGLMTKRRDLTASRADENRLRPQAAHS